MERQIIPKDLASEALNSEDFSRLNETAPRLMRVLAEGAGTSVCTLRKMAHEGRLTSAVLLGTAPAAAVGVGLESRVAKAMEEIGAWSALAFKSAALQATDDEFGRRFIEHGAVCYANCFLRLQAVLDDASPLPSKAPSGSQ